MEGNTPTYPDPRLRARDDIEGPRAAGALTSVAVLRDEIDRAENQLERLIEKVAPVLLPPPPQPGDTMSEAKRSDVDSELTTELNGLARRISFLSTRIGYIFDRVDL